MLVKDIVDENYQDYKKPSMFIASAFCDWKCCIENGVSTSACQNSEIAKQPSINILDENIVARYLQNKLTSAIVIGGLEPLLQVDEVVNLIRQFRIFTDDDIVIYTGYYPKEILNVVERLSLFQNIIIKYGRFIPNSRKKFDDTLGIWLQSENQYAKQL
jgi:organic radical activating enzyme